MSKKNNVNPDYYKTAGRERQGEDIAHDLFKRRYAQSRTVESAPARYFSGARQNRLRNRGRGRPANR
ncbi:MAG: hypothetical protein J2P21_20985 [Chloracidobacterium sp.]|nr:hypothetical protein [Chloracidobacterium sp.]